MSRASDDSITARLSLEVYREVAKRGVFGESVDDVLRRVFELGENDAAHRPGGRARRHNKKGARDARSNGSDASRGSDIHS